MYVFLPILNYLAMCSRKAITGVLFKKQNKQKNHPQNKNKERN